MASLCVSTPSTQNLRPFHKTCTDCPPPCIAWDTRHGTQLRLAVPNRNVSAINRCFIVCGLVIVASKGRVYIVRAGACPFGFKSSIEKGNRESSMEMNVATADPSVNYTPYAPVPSADAPDNVNLGPGTYDYLPLKIPYQMTMGIQPLDMEDWI